MTAPDRHSPAAEGAVVGVGAEAGAETGVGAGAGEAARPMVESKPRHENAVAGGLGGSGAKQAEVESAGGEDRRVSSPQELMQAIEDDPMIRRANELFGVNIDHGDSRDASNESAT